QGEIPDAQPACPRCGVIFAKLREPRPRPQPAAPTVAPRPAEPGYGSLVAPVLITALLLGTTAAWLRRRAAPAAPAPPRPAAAAPAAPAPLVEDLPPPSLTAEPTPPPIQRVQAADGLSEADAMIATALGLRSQREPLSAADLQAAEGLYS